MEAAAHVESMARGSHADLSAWLRAVVRAFADTAPMFGLPAPTEGEPQPPRDLPGAYLSMACDGHSYMVGVMASRSDAAWMAYLLDPEDGSPDASRELLCELANVVAGAAKTLMSQSGHQIELELGLPLYAEGQIHGPALPLAASLPLTMDGHVCHAVVLRAEPTPDVKERKRLRAAVVDRERRLDAILSNLADAVVVCDRAGRVEQLNPAASRLLSPIAPGDALEARVPGWGATARRGELTLRVGDAIRHVEIAKADVEGRELTATILRDITERRRAQAELEQAHAALAQETSELLAAQDRITRLANFDHLTGLANRRYIESLAGRMLFGAKRTNKPLAVLSIDLDRFKQVNDAGGHGVGDELLKQTAERLMGGLRATDWVGRTGDSQVARLGGDEFMIVLTDIRAPEDAGLVASRLIELVAEPYLIEGTAYHVSASIGIAVYPEHGDDHETLVRHSDAALYHAKASGRNGYCFFTDELSERARRRAWIERELRLAIEQDALTVFYQPRVGLEGGSGDVVVGAEALVRWRHPEEGFISPGEFIPVAEDTGLVLPLGERVLRRACLEAKSWADAGMPLTISVNVAPVQLVPEFVDVVKDALAQSGLAPERLELEITERTILDRTDQHRSLLEQFEEAGVLITVDDFGTGYSSLSYLASFPIDVIKIDRSFVSQVCEKNTSAAITGAVIALGHALGATIVAEGVETEEQLAFLREQGCDEVQGFFFGRPMCPEDFVVWARGFGDQDA